MLKLHFVFVRWKIRFCIFKLLKKLFLIVLNFLELFRPSRKRIFETKDKTFISLINLRKTLRIKNM